MDILDILSKVGQILTGVLMPVLFYMNWRLTKDSKRLECRMEFNRRFDELESVRKGLRNPSDPNDPETKDYYRRFFNLQSNQYEEFTRNFVDEEAFTHWALMRCSQFAAEMKQPENEPKMYKITWNSMKSDWGKHDFTEFLESVFQAAWLTSDRDQEIAIKKLIWKHRLRKWFKPGWPGFEPSRP
jgi:hypothetical protein